MPLLHVEKSVSFNSPYLGQVDPATKTPFTIGEVVIICEQTKEALSIKSISAYDNHCPFCGEEIYTAYSTNSKPAYPSELSWGDSTPGFPETLFTSALIGGVGGIVFSLLLLQDGFLKFIVQVVVICLVMILSFLATKQPLGAIVAVLFTNLTPLFFGQRQIDGFYILFFFISTGLVGFISISIKRIFE